MPVFLDEINIESGLVVQTIPMPITETFNPDGSTASYRCTLPLLGGAEGYLQVRGYNISNLSAHTHTRARALWRDIADVCDNRSPFFHSMPDRRSLQPTADRRAITFGCYSALPGQIVNNTGTVRRVMAVVWADGRIDTTTSCADCFVANITGLTINIRGVASADVYSGFLMTGFQSTAITTGGLRYLAYGASTSTQLAPTVQRYVQFETEMTSQLGGPVVMITLAATGANGMYFLRLNNISQYDPAVIGTYAQSQWSMLSGQEAMQLWSTVTVAWQYVVQPGGNIVYVTDTSNGGRAAGQTGSGYNIYTLQWNSALGRYSNLGFISLDNTTTTQILTGRMEAGQYVLYAGTSTRLYRYNTVTQQQSLVRFLDGSAWGNFMLGVQWVPVDNS